MKQTQADIVLHRLQQGPMCSQGFFHEDSHIRGITHRVAAAVKILRDRGHDIVSEPCTHGRRGAKDYKLYLPGEQAAWF